MSAQAPSLPTFDDVRQAAKRLHGVAVRTPLLESVHLNDQLGCRLLVKAECLQRTGSFKFRGAYNRLAQLSDVEKKRGIVAFSSGNHAQGVAAAARILGIPATIVMPSDAPAIKTANTKADGATVVPYERRDANRVAIATKIMEETGAVLVPPYDDPHIMAGQGTAGLETIAQAREMGATVDLFLAPVSGGGLIGGCALAFEGESPSTKLYATEPEDFDDTAQSVAAERRIEITPGKPSICDALLVETPGALSFEVNKRRLEGGLRVSDNEALAAMATAFNALKIVLEPSGAVPLAAVLNGRVDVKGKTVAVLVSGGNVDPNMFCRAILDGS